MHVRNYLTLCLDQLTSTFCHTLLQSETRQIVDLDPVRPYGYLIVANKMAKVEVGSICDAVRLQVIPLASADWSMYNTSVCDVYTSTTMSFIKHV